MIILHASFSNPFLFFWGETSENIPSGGEKKAISPYDLGEEGILSLLREMDPGNPLPRSQKKTVWLPTDGERPIPSSPMIEECSIGSNVKMSPWEVTALALPTHSCVPLLRHFEGKKVVSPGVLLGEDFRYWAFALQLAEEILAGQKFLPSLSKKEGKYQATWKPLFLGDEKERLTRLSQAMPGVCRAMVSSSEEALSSQALLGEFVQIVVDFQLRASLKGKPVAEEKSSSKKGPKKKKVTVFETLHDRWLFALRSTEGSIAGTPEELERLAQQIEEWQRPLWVPSEAPFRLCFRIREPVLPPVEEPRAEKEPIIRLKKGSTLASEKNKNRAIDAGARWNVEYLLHPLDDPSLLLPVQEAWESKRSKASLFKRAHFDIQEYLFASLGSAAKISKDIEISLKQAKPSGYSLDDGGAYLFLSEVAWLLKQMGFGVLCPSWWTGKGSKTRLSLRANIASPPMKSKKQISMDEIVSFDWRLALGEQTLSEKELEELARRKSSLVRLRGQWIEVDQEEIRRALSLWGKKERLTAREAIRRSLGATPEGNTLDVSGVDATGWVSEVLDEMQKAERMANLPVPREFSGALRPYQLRGYSWLHFLQRFGFGACLADDMGLGKTIQTLTLLQQKREEGEKKPSLLICPTSVTTNWIKESKRFAPSLRVMLHHGAQRPKGAKFKKKASQSDLVVSSYSLLHRDLQTFKDVSWAGVVLDEAQNIKNYETKQAKSACALSCDYRIALTGTPVENNIGELWSIMQFLNPGFLGQPTAFKKKFFTPIQSQGDERAMKALKRMTGPFILRRLKSDRNIIQDLPEKVEMKVFCPLTKEQASLYSAILQDSMAGIEEAEGIQRKGLVLSLLLKLKQVCNHPAHFLKDQSTLPKRSGKLERLTELVEEILETDDRMLLFTQFTEMGEMLKKHAQETFGEEVFFLHGGTSREKREEMVERFQHDDKGPRLFILSLKAGGTGLNLMRASHVFHFDRWWNPAVENQATDRAFRIGQHKNVRVHKFVCTGTVEEKIDEMIERKKQLAEQTIGSGENWLTELSTDRLKAIFALDQSFVEE